MNTEHDQSAPELLSAFADGELSGVQETLLFRYLADDQELRWEFREILALRTAAHSDREVLQPPANMFDAVLQRAGLAVQPESGKAKRAAGLFLLAFLRRQKAPILAAAFASLCTALLFLGLQGGEVFKAPAQGSPAAIADSELPTPAGEPANLNAGTLQDGSGRETGSLATASDHRARPAGIPANANRHIGRKPVNEMTPDKAEAALAPIAVVEELSEKTQADISHSAALEAGPMAAMPLHSVRQPFPDAQRHIVLPGITLGVNAVSAAGIALHVRGIEARSFPKPTIAPSSDPWFNDMALGLEYALNQSHSLFIEGGQEPYFQEFGRMEGGEQVRYQQSATLFWLGAGWQFRVPELRLPGGIVPHARIMAAGSRQGPMGRMLIGLDYQPDSRVRFSLDLESSLLFYRFDNTWLTSRKLGISYGISLHL